MWPEITSQVTFQPFDSLMFSNFEDIIFSLSGTSNYNSMSKNLNREMRLILASDILLKSFSIHLNYIQCLICILIYTKLHFFIESS